MIKLIMRFLSKLTVLYHLTTLSFSCTNHRNIPADITEILEKTEHNEQELLKVIDHYSKDHSDTLKLKAVYYLIKNFDGLLTLDSNSVNTNNIYFEALESMWKKNKKELINPLVPYIIDSVNKKYPLNQKFSSAKYFKEIDSIKSGFLIRNIDLAFNAWTLPWSKHFSFQYFCEYILPYRCTNTYASYGREYFINSNQKTVDSFKNCLNPFDVADVVIQDIDSWFVEETQLFRKHPYLRPIKFTNLIKGRVGLCIDANSIKVTALRSLGIATALDEVPNWGSANGAHYWYKIIDPLNDTIKSLISNENSPKNTHHIISSSSYWPRDVIFEGIPKDVSVSYNRTVPKVYRNTFSKQSDNLAAVKSNDDDIPGYFRNIRLKDVTENYVETSDVTVKLTIDSNREKYAYLCVFDNNDWRPVAWAAVINNTATFKKMGRNIMYLPIYYINGQIVPAGKPFLLSLDGITQQINPETNKISIRLFTKYPYRNHINFYQSANIGGRFQFSNREDFADSTTVFTITKLPFYNTSFKVDTNKKYRYLFFQFAGLYFCTFAELEFYSENSEGKEIKLHGVSIGNKGMYPDTAQKMFDGNNLSVFARDKKKESFVGIDLGKGNEKKVTRIRFVPRTDGNIVEHNENYELFYWNNEWISLGIKKADSHNTVVFLDVPKNSLFLLKNIKGGTENRIFTYRADKQDFW